MEDHRHLTEKKSLVLAFVGWKGTQRQDIRGLKQHRVREAEEEAGVLRTGHESGLDDWSGGGGKMGRLVISRMRSWGSLLKAVGSHGKV